MGDGSINERIRLQVLERVGGCFSCLIGGSGHLATYFIDASTFQVDRVEKIDAGRTRYHFSAVARYESEFTVYDENTPQEPERVIGNIILDQEMDYAYDEEGKVLLYPYKTAITRTNRDGTEKREVKNTAFSTQDIDDLLGGSRHDRK